MLLAYTLWCSASTPQGVTKSLCLNVLSTHSVLAVWMQGTRQTLPSYEGRHIEVSLSDCDLKSWPPPRGKIEGPEAGSVHLSTDVKNRIGASLCKRYAA